ncbi:hypothetical protein DK847_17310 [Aestuariivirga litoralis]|uniref:Uncharacterized protein n=2 Tax=Aestuariivirga litoralis TaxID=2650924 RepID=A0A2W2AJV5_9HYPH|nr:hypothetical protein DK847_17310 [Aestuariivirga litoralis]
MEGVTQTAADFTAEPQENDMKKILIATIMTAIAAAALPTGVAFAKRGADDPAGHVRHGGDDGAGHQRHGRDDGARHR